MINKDELLLLGIDKKGLCYYTSLPEIGSIVIKNKRGKYKKKKKTFEDLFLPSGISSWYTDFKDFFISTPFSDEELEKIIELYSDVYAMVKGIHAVKQSSGDTKIINDIKKGIFKRLMKLYRILDKEGIYEWD